MSTPHISRHDFSTEVTQLLDIVIHSLYTDKEVFIRELVSNASDALEKLRHLEITEKAITDDNLGLEINLTTDETSGTLTIQDFGIGMTREETIQNLGTIAHSGSKAFLEALKKGDETNKNLIGRFGVGFYSAFIVAKEVKVYSRSWRKSAPGVCWTSDGLGSYTVEEAQGQRRGCRIILTLKDDHRNFAQSTTVKRILQRYSSFVPFPIHLNGDRINTVKALWLENRKDIKAETYQKFYKFHSNAYDEARTWLHFNVDAPISLNALLFVPNTNPEALGFTSRLKPSVALHCRNVLIDAHPQGLLPEWLRFLRGIVDSADLPLNISRESLQDNQLIQKINRLLTKRFLKHLEDLTKIEPQAYEGLWQHFGVYLKEGSVTDPLHREQLAKLLRFASSWTTEISTSLDDYTSRMPSKQKDIYYLHGPSRESIEAGPYLEAFKTRNIEVLFLYDPIDTFVMNHLAEFAGKRLVSGDQKDLDLGELPAESTIGDPLPEKKLTQLCTWIQTTLGNNVEKVTAGKRLVGSPAVALPNSPISPTMQRMMKTMHPQTSEQTSAIILEINPRHPLIKNLSTLHETNPLRARTALEQLFDNTLIAAGIIEDAKPMLTRLYKILETLTEVPRPEENSEKIKKTS